MGFVFFQNGVSRYIDHYDPLPDYDRPRRTYRNRMPESYPRGWW